MWFFILYVVVMIIWIACVNRYYEDHEVIDDGGFDDLSDQETLQIGGVVWPITICMLLIVGLIYGTYKGIYYVVDKIYTKIVSNRNREDSETA